jgi:DNA-binding Lrp family transcriptional regulator
MDKNDMLLSLDLIKNSRISYRTLADKYNLSVNAVHKRIKNNIKSGTIKNFTAKISLKALNSFPFVIFGKSNSSDIGKNIQAIGKKKTYQIVIAAGNYLYISGYLQNKVLSFK